MHNLKQYSVYDINRNISHPNELLNIVYYTAGIALGTGHSLIRSIDTAKQQNCANIIPILQIREPICRKIKPLT